MTRYILSHRGKMNLAIRANVVIPFMGTHPKEIYYEKISASVLPDVITVNAADSLRTRYTAFQNAKPAGFFWGIWHGWIAPVSLIWHCFDPSVRIYETNNTGGWYDFGFYIAIVGGFGGFAFSRRRS